MTLAATVANLQPGQKVRIGLTHRNRPAVGTLRETTNPHLDWAGQSLFLDVPAGHMVRDHVGKPGWSIRWVELLTPTEPTREEHLALIDEAADNWLIAQAAWQSATASETEHLLVKARAAYEAFLETVGAPYEVTA